MVLTLAGLLSRYENDPFFLQGSEIQIDSVSIDGDSLLHRVCTLGDFEAVSLLIQGGVNVNLQGDMGSTPLHNAVEHLDLKIAELLLESGADPYIKNEFGDDCLAWAISCKNAGAVSLLRRWSSG